MSGQDYQQRQTGRHAPDRSGAIVPGIDRTERDFVALGIILAAIILFVGTGSSVLTRLVRHYLFGENSVDALLANALLLNIALIIFGWRRYVDLTREVAARREAEQAALRLADTDPLTGLLNRRSFDAVLNAMAAATAGKGGSLALLLIDLDRFKLANDAHGHHVGDAVLVEAARRTRAMLPTDAALARLGGDEFAALVPFRSGVDSADLTGRLGAGIGDAIALPIHCDGHTVVVSASIGMACADIGPNQPIADTAALLMHQADVAMYQAKKGGRSQQCWFSPDIEHTMLARSRLEQAIRVGLQNGEFRPFYEKQVDLASGAITGLEMLARWHSPENGIVGPDVFVPVAEDMGVMPDLSEALIRQALADAREWAPHLTLAINISPVQLRDPWFAQRLLKLLVEARVPPHRLDIEITEDCLADNLPMVRSLVTSLRNQGVRISLDDFGHCASSLAHLRTLPFDRIKIDRNFIAGLGHSRDSSAVVEAISSLGQGMDLPITAEGIENEAILAELRRLGPFLGQGYIYGRPLSAEDLRSELAGQGLLAENTTDIFRDKDARSA
ncbi:putative bifunctional diguanylate cyclase/phosphodiesterase [Novosphingobium acidiphilum]|uniref:putative bifunctional diguanylate cyclase/phosphodiesterase n=1 Tax=Novosphingobium acidiphilum TaxID=505248 RepID=UPI000417AA21|nr:EAL domain-containing protein [Novosphingobium acidiphilum]